LLLLRHGRMIQFYVSSIEIEKLHAQYIFLENRQ
jgi:hypothetical protein